MTWPTSIIIDTVFIPIYLVLAGPALLNCIKHGRGKSAGFVSLLVFVLVRIVGNIMIVAEYNSRYSSIDVTIWGYILQSIGYSFLYSSSLSFYLRAEETSPDHSSSPLVKPPRFLHLANLAALICVIVGQTSVKYTDANGNMISPHLPIEATIGAIIYIVITAVLMLLVVSAMFRRVQGETYILLTALCIAVPLMLVRAAYSCYATFSDSVLMPNNIWVKLMLQYVIELVVISIYTFLGFLITRKSELPPYDLDVEQDLSMQHVISDKSLSSNTNQSAAR